MKKIILIFLAFNAIALLGLAVFVLATGRLDGTKIAAMLDMLQQPSTPPELRKKVGEIFHPTAVTATSTAPSSQPVAVLVKAPSDDGGPGLATASDRLEYTRQAIERERLKLDRDAQDLQHRQELLETQRRELDTKLAAIRDEEKKFEARVLAAQTKSKDENFTRTLALYHDLKPKQVKDLFQNLNPDLVADYLKAMEPEQATRVISEFKSPEERTYISGVIEKIRSAGTLPASTAPAAATAPG